MNRVRQFVEFFDSVEFITVLITSLTTFVSVVGAYCILRIFQQRDQNYAELGKLRVALAVYFDAANTSISMKDQLLKEMCGNYVLSRETYLRLVEEKRQPAGGQFKIPLDFRSLSEVRIVGNDEAVSLLADIDLPPMTMVAARIASRAADSKNNLIRSRNKFIDIWKENENIWSDKEKICRCFGIERDDGSVDEFYLDTMKGLKNRNDECIYFSIFVCRALERRRENLKRKLGMNAQEKRFSFDIAEQKNLLPSSEDFSEWEAFDP